MWEKRSNMSCANDYFLNQVDDGMGNNNYCSSANMVYAMLNHPNFEDGNLFPQNLFQSDTNELMTYNDCADLKYSSDNDNDTWKSKHPSEWDSIDILKWINYEAARMNICCTDIRSENFSALSGRDIDKFSLEDFSQCEKQYGSELWRRLQGLKSNSECINYEELSVPIKNVKREDLFDNVLTSEKSTPDYPFINNENISISMGHIKLNDARPLSPPPPPPPPPIIEKKRPGRPKAPLHKKKKKPEKLGRLWEFLRDLLKNQEFCPSLIQWDNYEEGMFRFVHSDKVAKLWGTKKDNPDMNYEKLSRAMRYYYKSQVLLPVLGRRLVYKFGPNATGWRVDNPNFKTKIN